jgi:leucyl-tRNA synthetase
MTNYEKRWSKVWKEKGVFESDAVAGKKKSFVTVPYPYMNGPVHVGTAFTALRVDYYARFRRLQGYNVLFPYAWHWTGQTIVGLSYRLKHGDAKARRAFIEVDGVPEADVEKFVDPEYLASYYTKVSRQVMQDTGMSIDWRREFRTIDPAYKKFVEWQYLKLKELGYVVQGTHPVVWCSHDQSPTGDHDRMEGEGVSPEEFNLIKFQMGEFALVAATLRPETIYGATNIWVNPDAEYSEARVDGELWVVSSSCLGRLNEQKRQVTPVRSFKGSDLLGRYAMVPLTGQSLPILPAGFVDADLGTGVVYSVPAHAPYDYMALADIQQGRVQVSRQVKEVADDLRPISVIRVKGYSEFPAADAVRAKGVSSSADPKVEEATDEVYKAEFHTGEMKANSGPLSGLAVSEAKAKAVELISKTERLTKMLDLPERVVCRCGTRCYVKILENQWFLNYSDPKWKDRTRELITKAAVLPPESRAWYFSTIDWLDDRPCARKSGMGTKVPWDKDWIIETLSDSTIYMAYYTISKYVNQEKVGAESFTPEVLDYIFMGKGSAPNLAKGAGITEKLLKEMRTEFAYWYPVDMRNSAKELIPNHLTFFAFHHAAIFPEKQWPKCFSVNGMIQIDGAKMSKTAGNFVTWKKALEESGADALRLSLALTADGMDDADWRMAASADAAERIASIIPFVKKAVKGSTRREKDSMDKWLISQVHRMVESQTGAMEEMKMRKAASVAFLELWNDLRWYLRRTAKPRRQTLEDVFAGWVRLISPFTPFVAEELNKVLGGKGLASQADWPSPKDFPLDTESELAEHALERVMEDARRVLKVVKGNSSRLNVYVASDEVASFFSEACAARRAGQNVGPLVKKHAALKVQPDRIFKLQYELGEELTSKYLEAPNFDEFKALSGASDFLSRELGLEVTVQKAGSKGVKDPHDRARSALPLKPAFYLE